LDADPFSEVNGKGIEKLLAHGVQVDYPVLNHNHRIEQAIYHIPSAKRPILF
jgi:pyrimidine deaminase RibD-like protein